MNCPQCSVEIDEDITMANADRCVMCQGTLDAEKFRKQLDMPAITYLRTVCSDLNYPAYPLYLDVTSFFLVNERHIRPEYSFSVERWQGALTQFPYLPSHLCTRDIHISEGFFSAWRKAKDLDEVSVKVQERLKDSYMSQGTRMKTVEGLFGLPMRMYMYREDFWCVMSAPQL